MLKLFNLTHDSWIGFINKDRTNIIKGILIFLIVLGHNSILTKNINGLFNFLYSFHIFAFFILPWFYNQNKITVLGLKKRLTKLYFWYLVFYILQYVIYNYIFTNNGGDLDLFIWAFMHGSHMLLEKSVGFEYLWFLPAFFFAMLYKDIYYSLPQKGKQISHVIAIGVILINWTLGVKYQSMPCIYQGLFFTSYGLLAITPPRKYRAISLIAIILFIILPLFFSQTTISKLIMPFAGFFTILYICTKFENLLQWLKPVGELSLYIYLIHPLVFHSLKLLLLENIITPITTGAIFLFLTFSISFILSYIANIIIRKSRIGKYVGI